MTDITPLIKVGSRVIQSYGDNSVRVSGVVYTSPLCVTVDDITPWSGNIADLINLPSGLDIELMLIGITKIHGPVSNEIRHALRTRGWSVEVMDIGAACRTYNVLMADGRKVGAALQITQP